MGCVCISVKIIVARSNSLTITSNDSVHQGYWGSACKVISLVNQSLLHRFIAHQNYSSLGSNVHRQHWAVSLTPLLEETRVYGNAQVRSLLHVLMFLFPHNSVMVKHNFWPQTYQHKVPQKISPLIRLYSRNSSLCYSDVQLLV